MWSSNPNRAKPERRWLGHFPAGFRVAVCSLHSAVGGVLQDIYTRLYGLSLSMARMEYSANQLLFI